MFTRFVATQIRDEFISSEENYVKELRTLVMVFLRPLEKWVAEGMNGLGIPAGEHCRLWKRADCTRCHRCCKWGAFYDRLVVCRDAHSELEPYCYSGLLNCPVDNMTLCAVHTDKILSYCFFDMLRLQP